MFLTEGGDLRAPAGRVRKHGNRYRFDVQIEGRRVIRSFESERRAEEALAHLLSEAHRHREIRAARTRGVLTVGEVVDEYYQRRKRSLELSTQAKYEQLMDCYISRIADRNARALVESPSELQDFYDSLPPVSAERVHQILRPAFQQAVDHRHVERNPCDVARPRRSRADERLIPTAQEVEKIVLAAEEEDPRWGLFVRICATLGVRRGEACGLRFEDLDFEESRVRIRRAVAKVKGGVVVKRPKAGEARTLVVGEAFFEWLEPFREDEGWVFHGTGPRRPELARGVDELVLRLLHAKGGRLACSDGGLGSRLSELLGLTAQSGSAILRRLEARGLATVERAPRRTYSAAITASGRRVLEAPPVAHPPHPDSVGHRFEELTARLEMPYTLHSLRHFVATSLYNRTRDWVQLARFLGHRTPAITMNLYANHVVEDSQVVLGRAAAELVPGL